MTLLTPAIALAALPELSTTMDNRAIAGESLCLAIGGARHGLDARIPGDWSSSAPNQSSHFAFGDEFKSYSELLIPIGVGQLIGCHVHCLPEPVESRSGGQRHSSSLPPRAPQLCSSVPPVLGLDIRDGRGPWGLTIASTSRGGLATFASLRRPLQRTETGDHETSNQDRSSDNDPRGPLTWPH